MRVGQIERNFEFEDYSMNPMSDPAEKKLYLLNKLTDTRKEEERISWRDLLNSHQLEEYNMNSKSILPEVASGVRYTIDKKTPM